MAANCADGTDTARPRYEGGGSFVTSFTSESGQSFRIDQDSGLGAFVLTEVDSSACTPIWSQSFTKVGDLERLTPAAGGMWDFEPIHAHLSMVYEGYEGANSEGNMALKRGGQDAKLLFTVTRESQVSRAAFTFTVNHM